MAHRQIGLSQLVNISILPLSKEHQTEPQLRQRLERSGGNARKRIGEFKETLCTDVVVRGHLLRRVHVELPGAFAQLIREMRAPHFCFQLK